MATPTIIPIHCDRNTHSGLLGICKTTLVRSTELEAVYPKRGGVYDRRNASILPRPHYYERDASGKRVRTFKVQCSQCGFYQRRDAFRRDGRKRNGLASECNSCHALNMRRARFTAIAA